MRSIFPRYGMQSASVRVVRAVTAGLFLTAAAAPEQSALAQTATRDHIADLLLRPETGSQGPSSQVPGAAENRQRLAQ